MAAYPKMDVKLVFRRQHAQPTVNFCCVDANLDEILQCVSEHVRRWGAPPHIREQKNDEPGLKNAVARNVNCLHSDFTDIIWRRDGGGEEGE